MKRHEKGSVKNIHRSRGECGLYVRKQYISEASFPYSNARIQLKSPPTTNVRK